MHDRFGSAGFLAAYHAGPCRLNSTRNRKAASILTTAYIAAVTPLLDNEQGEHAAADGRRALLWGEAPLFVERAGACDRRSSLHSRRCTIMTPIWSSLVWAMPSARALLVASLLTEPPCGCLGPSGNDRYRERSLRQQTVRVSQVICQSRGGPFAINRPAADVLGRALLENPPQ